MFKYFLIVFLLSILKNFNAFDKVISISDYNYPLPEPEESDKYSIAVVSTNDIHGAAFPIEGIHPVTKKEFSYAGLEYMANEIQAIKNEWGNRLIWLDAGDQFQGALENTLSKGQIISSFFNHGGLTGAPLGNHEFDFDQDWLLERMNNSTYNWHLSNVYNDKGEVEFTPNSYETKIYNVGDVKVGVIGLSTIQTPTTTSGDLTNFNFKDYAPIIKALSPKLRNEGKVDLVLINSHVGMNCDYNDLYELKVRSKTSSKEKPEDVCDTNDEMYKLLLELEDGLVDGVIGGHRHAINHHWVNNVPFLSNINAGKYFHVAYFTFKKETNNKFTYLPDETKIEGPVPVCDKIWIKTKICDINNFEQDPGDYYNFLFHNQYIRKDKSVKPVFDHWYSELNEYRTPYATTELPLERSKEKDVVLVNYICDCTQREASVDFVVFNGGMFRSEWIPGKINDYLLLSMFPFGGDIFKFNIKGSDVKKMMSTIQEGIKGFYGVSGLKTYVDVDLKLDTKKVTSIKMKDDLEIEDEKMYSMASNDFLLEHYGDDFSLLKDWFKPELTLVGKDVDVYRKCLKEDKVITPKTSMSYTRLNINYIGETDE